MRGKYKNKKQDIGMAGEELICNYLIENGHKIISRNWRAGHLEIDIISEDIKGIHFIEVKTRITPIMIEPERCVNYKKQHNIIKAATIFINKFYSVFGDKDVHLDIGTVIFDGDTQIINYIADAYLPILT